MIVVIIKPLTELGIILLNPRNRDQCGENFRIQLLLEIIDLATYAYSSLGSLLENTCDIYTL